MFASLGGGCEQSKWKGNYGNDALSKVVWLYWTFQTHHPKRSTRSVWLVRSGRSGLPLNPMDYLECLLVEWFDQHSRQPSTHLTKLKWHSQVLPMRQAALFHSCSSLKKSPQCMVQGSDNLMWVTSNNLVGWSGAISKYWIMNEWMNEWGEVIVAKYKKYMIRWPKMYLV